MGQAPGHYAASFFLEKAGQQKRDRDFDGDTKSREESKLIERGHDHFSPLGISAIG